MGVHSPAKIGKPIRRVMGSGAERDCHTGCDALHRPPGTGGCGHSEQATLL